MPPEPNVGSLSESQRTGSKDPTADKPLMRRSRHLGQGDGSGGDLDAAGVHGTHVLVNLVTSDCMTLLRAFAHRKRLSHEELECLPLAFSADILSNLGALAPVKVGVAAFYERGRILI